MPGQRFFATRLNGDGTEDLISGDLPITGTPQLTDVLSGPPQLVAEISTARDDLKVKGQPVLVPGKTAIYYEEDDVIRGGWLLAEPDADDQMYRIDASGFCGYPQGQEYTLEYNQIGVDSLDVVRHIWGYLQSFPNGNLGMQLDATKSGVLLGTRATTSIPGFINVNRAELVDTLLYSYLDDDGVTWRRIPSPPVSVTRKVPNRFGGTHGAQYRGSIPDSDWFVLRNNQGWTSGLTGVNGQEVARPPGAVYFDDVSSEQWTKLLSMGWIGDPTDASDQWIYPPIKVENVTDGKWPIDAKVTLMNINGTKIGVRFRNPTPSLPGQVETIDLRDASKLDITVTPDTGDREDEYYSLAWFNPVDLGSEIDTLAKEGPFEYHELHYWNSTRTRVLHRLELGAPRLGGMRTDLRFVLGENIHVPPRVTFGGGYANEVTVIGAGQGRAMVRAVASVPDGRLRRAITITDKRIQTNAAAGNRARRELDARQKFQDVKTVVIEDTPGTPVGSWLVGDTIRLQAEESWTDLDMWVRVVGITTSPFENRDAVCAVIPA